MCTGGGGGGGFYDRQCAKKWANKCARGGGGGGGGVVSRQCAKKQTNLAEKTCTQCSSFQTVVSETGKTGAGGECPQ